MRPLVEPPPSLLCMCGGELRLKRIEPAVRNLGKQREIFVCTNCSREQTFLADRNPYVPPTACGARHEIRNRKAPYSAVWANLTVKRKPPDAKEWEGKLDKVNLLSTNPGTGD